MFTKQMKSTLVASGLLAVTLAGTPASLADGPLPVTGMPVPELAMFDQMMCTFMDDNNIEGGLLAIMKDGVIIYQRGFGWKNEGQTIPMRHDAVARIASITKPFTAAAVQHMYGTNALDPCDVVFDLGQQGGGLLPYVAFPVLQDNRMQQIQVQQIMQHSAGLPNNQGGDPMFQEITIADTMNDGGWPTSNPPGRVRTTQFVLGGNLINNPWDGNFSYSNFGFQVLGQVIEAQSGLTHVDYIKQNVMGPIDWMPLDEIVAGRSFSADRDAREPWYNFTTTGTNVFDPDGPNVRMPDGGYDHELHFASGGFVTSTTALVHLAERYYIQAENQGNAQADTYGALTNGVRSTRTHGGLLFGTAASLRQRSDGVNFAVIFNSGGPGNNPAAAMRTLLDNAFDNGGFTWPNQGVDGQWVDFNQNGGGAGSYEEPWTDVGIAKLDSMDEATLNFKAGTSNWTGTINKRLRLRAPEGGTVRIGQQ